MGKRGGGGMGVSHHVSIQTDISTIKLCFQLGPLLLPVMPSMMLSFQVPTPEVQFNWKVVYAAVMSLQQQQVEEEGGVWAAGQGAHMCRLAASPWSPNCMAKTALQPAPASVRTLLSPFLCVPQ